jgi:very-short-patch-repair endonuclease
MEINMKKTCKWCGKEFTPQQPSYQYCSRDCRIATLRRRVNLTCPVCGCAFEVVPAIVKKRRTCSRTCAMVYRKQQGSWASWNKGPRLPKKTCPQCGGSFQPHFSRQTFCSRKCATRSRSAEARERMRRLRAKLEQDPAYKQRMIERMRRNNPVHMPGVMSRIRSKLKNRADHLRTVRGGNGKRTKPQLLLHNRLGWPMEYPIPTGNPKWPTAVADLANPQLRIAIECDGSSHNNPRQRNIDRRKELMLSALGWVVLRFRNKEILEDTPRVLKVIRAAVKSRSSR